MGTCLHQMTPGVAWASEMTVAGGGHDVSVKRMTTSFHAGLLLRDSTLAPGFTSDSYPHHSARTDHQHRPGPISHGPTFADELSTARPSLQASGPACTSRYMRQVTIDDPKPLLKGSRTAGLGRSRQAVASAHPDTCDRSHMLSSCSLSAVTRTAWPPWGTLYTLHARFTRSPNLRGPCTRETRQLCRVHGLTTITLHPLHFSPNTLRAPPRWMRFPPIMHRLCSTANNLIPVRIYATACQICLLVCSKWSGCQTTPCIYAAGLCS